MGGSEEKLTHQYVLKKRWEESMFYLLHDDISVHQHFPSFIITIIKTLLHKWIPGTCAEYEHDGGRITALQPKTTTYRTIIMNLIVMCTILSKYTLHLRWEGNGGGEKKKTDSCWLLHFISNFTEINHSEHNSDKEMVYFYFLAEKNLTIKNVRVLTTFGRWWWWF